MTMSPRVRKLALTAHVSFSVGWLGAVAVFLALGVAGLASDDPAVVRAAYVAMETTGSYVLLPFALASLSTGILQSLGTSWGLFRHYWVVAKLAINLFAILVLGLYLQTLGALRDAAEDRTIALSAVENASPVVHAVAALLLLTVAVVLAVHKPPGLTARGRRATRAQP